MSDWHPPAGAPCGECPWRRDAFPGYLGPHSVNGWLAQAHMTDGAIACHLSIGSDGPKHDRYRHCAGAAIYRGNVCKGHVVTLPVDVELVFGSPGEFAVHHAPGEPVDMIAGLMELLADDS